MLNGTHAARSWAVLLYGFPWGPWLSFYGLLTLVQRPFVKKWIKCNQKSVRIPGKDHPVTSYFPHFGFGTNFGAYFYIFKNWTQNGPTFSSFSNLPTCKKTMPQRKKDAHGPSLHIRFLSKCHFWYGIYHHVFTFWSKPTFFNYCHILTVLCISDSNMGDPRLLLFQNRIVISA